MRRSGFAILACTTLLMSAGAAQASVTIATGATKNMSCSAGVCSPTAKKAVLNVNDLTNMLTSGDVKITTGAGAVTITVAAPFSWTSKHRLTLDANYNVSFKAPVTVAGQGAVTITYNDGGTGGDLLFFPSAKLDFWDLSSSLIVNGNRFTLVGDIPTLAHDIANKSSGSFALANDYDAHVDGTYRAAPIPQLAGTFEGLGHTIDRLKIHSQDKFVGLFGTLKGAALARDIVLTHAALQVTRHTGGAVAGRNLGTIHQAAVNGTLSGTAGSLVVGWNYGTIDKAQASGTVLTDYMSGGGLAGLNWGTISFSSANVNVTGRRAGGLVAYNAGLIQDCFANGAVEGTGSTLDGAGGLLGQNDGGSVVRSYATGDVSGGDLIDYVGGLAGWNHDGGQIDQVYSLGRVSGPKDVGGLIGYEGADAQAAHGYWDIDTSGMRQGCGNGACSGVTGLSDTQLKSELPAGFDPAVWGQKKSINNGYPYLLANPPPQ